MAGDWHAIDLDLPDQIEVQTIIEMTDEPLDTVCGRLLLFWLWINKSTTQAIIAGISTKTLSRRFGGDEKFWRAVEKSGWLIIREDGIEVPGYERRFSNSAKQRLQDARRQSKHRERKEVAEPVTGMSHSRHADVTNERDNSVTGALPKEEKIKRIEENKEEEIPLPPFRTDPEFDPEVADGWARLERVAATAGKEIRSNAKRRRWLSDARQSFSIDDLAEAYRWLLRSPRAQNRRDGGASIDTLLNPDNTANYVEASKEVDAWSAPKRDPPPGKRSSLEEALAATRDR